MIPEVQQEALKALGEVLALSPDIRLGQLFAHLGFLGECHLDRGLGYIDDDELVAVLYRHRAELLARVADTQQTSSNKTTGFTGSTPLETALTSAKT